MRHSMDEEYFRDSISAISNQGINSPSGKVWKKTVRSLHRRPQKRSDFNSRLAELEIRTPTGLYIGKRLTLGFKEDRTKQVLLKIAKGLYAHSESTSVNPDHRADVNLLTVIPQDLLGLPIILSHEGVFVAAGGTAIDAPVSVYVMVFYDRVAAYATLAPVDTNWDNQ
jgi:hypothetical protein